jgi:hypothetical protein
MARRTKRNRRTRRTRRKSTISKLEISLRKTIERSIRKSLKKLTNRKTKKKKRKTKRKKKLQRGGDEQDKALIIKIFNRKFMNLGKDISSAVVEAGHFLNRLTLQGLQTKAGLIRGMREIITEYLTTRQIRGHDRVLTDRAVGEGKLDEKDIKEVLELIIQEDLKSLRNISIGGKILTGAEFTGGGEAILRSMLIDELVEELFDFYEGGQRAAQEKKGPPPLQKRAVPVQQEPVPLPVQQGPVPVQQGPELEPVQQEQQEPEPGGVPLQVLFDPGAGLASPIPEEDDEDPAAAAAKIQAAERGRQDRQAFTQKRAAATTIQSAARMRLAQEQRRLLAEQREEQQREEPVVPVVAPVVPEVVEEPAQAVEEPEVVGEPEVVEEPEGQPGGQQGPEPPPAPAGVGVVAAGSNCKEIQENITMLQQKIKTLEDDKRRLQEAIGARPAIGIGSAAALVASQQELERVQQSLAQVQAELDQCIQQKDFLMNELKKLIKELYCSILTKVRISRLVKAAAAHLLPEPLRRDIGLGEYNHLTYEFVLHALLSDNLLNNLSRGLPGPPILTPEERNEILQAEGLVAIPDGAQEMVGRVHGSLLNHIRLSRLGPVA